jgi:hypothetical protein
MNTTTQTTFDVRITLGNDAMESANDVAAALRSIANRLDNEHATQGVIRDANGNAVGEWIYKDGIRA